MGFVNDADVQLAYQRQLEVIGFDNMKKVSICFFAFCQLPRNPFSFCIVFEVGWEYPWMKSIGARWWWMKRRRCQCDFGSFAEPNKFTQDKRGESDNS